MAELKLCPLLFHSKHIQNQSITITKSGITACNSTQTKGSSILQQQHKTYYHLISFHNRMRTSCYHSVIIGLFSLALGFCSFGFCSSDFLRQNNLINLQYNLENKTNTSLYSGKRLIHHVITKQNLVHATLRHIYYK